MKQLNGLLRSAHQPANGRTFAERSVYRVVATVTASINEDDGDVHLVLTRDDGSTLIAKAPEPACTVGARDRAGWSHQIGHAGDYVELHPLQSLRRL